MLNKIKVPQGMSVKEFYFNQVQGVSNSRLGEVKRIMEGNLDFVFPEGAARMGNQVDAILTQPDQIDFSLSPEEMKQAMRISHTATQHPLIKMLVDKAEPQAIYTNILNLDLNGIGKEVQSKCMLDLCFGTIGADIKTTAATSQPGFDKAIERFDYRRQAVWYMLTANLTTFVFIGLSKTYHTVFFEVIRKGDHKYMEGLEQVNTWAYYHDIV